MTEDESRDRMQAVVWPPAIPPSSPARPGAASPQVVRFGRAASAAAGFGAGTWICTTGYFLLLSALHRDPPGLNAVVHGAYFTGLICEAVGVGLGWKGRRARVGRTGLWLSLGFLGVMAVLTLLDHQTNGTGLWIWNDLESDDCGCGATV